jgi:hypothetical protein
MKLRRIAFLSLGVLLVALFGVVTTQAASPESGSPVVYQVNPTVVPPTLPPVVPPGGGNQSNPVAPTAVPSPNRQTNPTTGTGSGGSATAGTGATATAGTGTGPAPTAATGTNPTAQTGVAAGGSGGLPSAGAGGLDSQPDLLLPSLIILLLIALTATTCLMALTSRGRSRSR